MDMYLSEKSSATNEDTLKKKSGANMSADGDSVKGIEFEDREIGEIEVSLSKPPDREMVDVFSHNTRSKPYLIPASFKLKIDSFSNVKIHDTREVLTKRGESNSPTDVEYSCVLFDATN